MPVSDGGVLKCLRANKSSFVHGRKLDHFPFFTNFSLLKECITHICVILKDSYAAQMIAAVTAVMKHQFMIGRLGCLLQSCEHIFSVLQLSWILGILLVLCDHIFMQDCHVTKGNHSVFRVSQKSFLI